MPPVDLIYSGKAVRRRVAPKTLCAILNVYPYCPHYTSINSLTEINTMSERKHPLAETNPNPGVSTPHKSSKGKANASPGSSANSETNDVTLPKFVRIARPYWDIETEKHEKRREEAGDEDDDDRLLFNSAILELTISNRITIL